MQKYIKICKTVWKYAKIYKNMQQHIKICRKYAKIQNMQKLFCTFSLVYSF